MVFHLVCQVTSRHSHTESSLLFANVQKLNTFPKVFWQTLAVFLGLLRPPENHKKVLSFCTFANKSDDSV